MRPLFWISILGLSLLPGCAIGPAAQKADDVLAWTKDKLDKVDSVIATVNNKIDSIEAGAAAAGAPTGEGTTVEDVVDWLKENPGKSTSPPVLGYLAWLYVRGRRRKKALQIQSEAIAEADPAGTIRDAIAAKVGASNTGLAKELDLADPNTA